jgi:hypothetical protein
MPIRLAPVRGKSWSDSCLVFAHADKHLVIGRRRRLEIVADHGPGKQ